MAEQEPSLPTSKSSKSILGMASPLKARSRSPSPGPGPPSGITKGVALKVIQKKKVKGNEASVWGEMDVLKGLDHPNIVRDDVIITFPSSGIVTLLLRSSSTSGLNPGRNITSHSNSLLVENSSNELSKRESSQNETL